MLSFCNHKKFEKIDFSWKTHPDWKLLDVVYCSSCLPILFSPFLTEEGDCYIDGGILNNYPVIHCQNAIEDHDTIFGIIKTNFEKQKESRIYCQEGRKRKRPF